MRSTRFARGSLCAAFGALLITHCIGDGGFNQNERAAGGGDNGVDVGTGELAIDPTGKYLLSKDSERLIRVDLDSGAVRALPGLANTQRVTFDHAGSALFLTRSTASKPDAEDGYIDDLIAGKLERYDVDESRAVWSVDVKLSLGWDGSTLGAAPWLAVTEDDATLIVAYDHRIDVYDAISGKLRRKVHTEESIVDVDITPAQTQLVITTSHLWVDGEVRTKLQLVDLDTFESTTISVPNCSDELVITGDGKHAFLAPTTCQKDPVSVIDLEQAKFVRNLPGFGPVGLAADGALAVAFIDADNIDEALFDDPKQIPDAATRYHLMLIDTSTLKFDVIELGNALPRYAVAPDGKLLLIDSAYLWRDGRIRLLDVERKELVPVRGPSLRLESYAVTRDSQKVFLLDQGLYTITLTDRLAQAAPIEFTPTHLNITPDDALLVLRESENRLWLYDVKNGELGQSIVLSDAH